MIKNTRSQQGSVHVVITTALIAALVGALGFIFWQNVFMDDGTANTQPVQTETGATGSEENATLDTDTEKVDQPVLNTQYVNGVSFVMPDDFGTIIGWSSATEVTNISSDTLLSKEKDLYGDAELECEARSYSLGRISVRESSTPYPGFKVVKKLDSGKYLFYADDSKDSSCYDKRPKLREMISEQVSAIKSALAEAV